jgi:hypothetical protein
MILFALLPVKASGADGTRPEVPNGFRTNANSEQWLRGQGRTNGMPTVTWHVSQSDVNDSEMTK